MKKAEGGVVKKKTAGGTAQHGQAVDLRTQAPDPEAKQAKQNAQPLGLDALDLAHLAAQARFASLPSGEAVAEAYLLWCEATGLVRSQAQFHHAWELFRKDDNTIPMPDRWPATVGEFCRLIVHAKNKKASESRFKDFLKAQPGMPMTKQEESDWREQDLGDLQLEFRDRESWIAVARNYRRWWERERSESQSKKGKASVAKRAELAKATKSEKK